MAGNAWTREEDDRLRERYGRVTRRQLVIEFATRTLRAIEARGAILGINKPNRNWRAIAEAHKPRIVLARVVPMEVV